MARPLLSKFHVEGFRGIKELTIPKLGRVNLIVGKNGCGKSSLLEALQLYAGRGNFLSIANVIASRGEALRPRIRDAEDLEEVYSTLQNLFYGRSVFVGDEQRILIGTRDNFHQFLHIRPSRFRAERSEDGRQLKLIESPNDESPLDTIGLSVSYGDSARFYPFERSERLAAPLYRDLDEVGSEKVVAISTSGLSEERMGRLWDRITLTESEDAVVSALRIISPELERISLVQSSGRDRSFMVRLRNHSRPIPLKIMGDGLSRLMGIALALVNASDGMLLIDEIENGLHYSVQHSVWELIFQAAHDLNVQVVAATHSWDCVTAFQRAAIEDTNEAALLLRLQSSAGVMGATLFSERELAIATRDGIEVR